MHDETTVGFLKEAMSCIVTEERNGVFELTLTYPVTGGMFPELQIDRFVKAKPNDTRRVFLRLCRLSFHKHGGGREKCENACTVKQNVL